MSEGEAKHAIGLMSGTSMDGIDVAALVTDGRNLIEVGPAREYAYTSVQTAELTKAVDIGASADDPDALRKELSRVERQLTRWHAEAVARFERETGWRASLVGFHGQTVAHRPQLGWTLQLGDGVALARATGRVVVHDFRTADMEAGGEGAPLVPVYHEGLCRPLFDADTRCIAVVNIGGIANATVLRPGTPPSAFDCGPGNVLLDRWVQREVGVPYDAGGRIASEGRVVREWIDDEFAKPFFKRKGPRSLDRLDFELPEPAALDVSDGARTLARFTAEAIASSLRDEKPDLVVLCGGGRWNDVLVADLRHLLAGRVQVAEALGWNGGATEAEAFAYLAVRSLRGDPITFPQTTGCRAPVTGGRTAQP